MAAGVVWPHCCCCCAERLVLDNVPRQPVRSTGSIGCTALSPHVLPVAPPTAASSTPRLTHPVRCLLLLHRYCCSLHGLPDTARQVLPSSSGQHVDVLPPCPQTLSRCWGSPRARPHAASRPRTTWMVATGTTQTSGYTAWSLSAVQLARSQSCSSCQVSRLSTVGVAWLVNRSSAMHACGVLWLPRLGRLQGLSGPRGRGQASSSCSCCSCDLWHQSAHALACLRAVDHAYC
jgi:hypothetical protein